MPAVDVGEVGGERLEIRCDGATLKASVEELYDPWYTALPRALDM